MYIVFSNPAFSSRNSIMEHDGGLTKTVAEVDYEKRKSNNSTHSTTQALLKEAEDQLFTWPFIMPPTAEVIEFTDDDVIVYDTRLRDLDALSRFLVTPEYRMKTHLLTHL
jgi:hypothetical protein